MYNLRHKRPHRFDFDLIVIGTGSGGGVAAHIAATAGKKVGVIEMEKIGGECPNFGCVPTKALLQAAEAYEAIKHGKEFGVNTEKVTIDYHALKHWKDLAVKRTGTSEGEDLYESEHITVIHGHAHFLSPWTVSVNGKRFSARHFLVATGTKSVIPPIPGLKEAGFLTYRDALDLTQLPSSLFVLGGGAIGCEFTQLYSTFGVKVHIADAAPRLVALEDPEVGELLEALFTERGVEIHCGIKVTRISKKGAQKVVHFEKDGKAQHAIVDEILLSAGKAANTDLGLENAGVVYDRGGIKVGDTMQTSTKHIYASGDVVGPYRFTHMASYQSRIAAHNMFHDKHKKTADYHAVPRCVFVDPEIACVGMTEQQLKDKGIKYQTAGVPISLIGRANTSNQDSGFVKVIATKDGTILGASIVSPRAGEMIHELTLAVQQRLKARSIAETIHAFPTWSEAVRLACQKIKSK